MTNAAYKKQVNKADILNAKIDKFIESVRNENDYFGTGLIMKRLLKQADESDVEDIIFELESSSNFKVIKIESLAEVIRFEQFESELKENPYQLKAFA